MPRIIVTADPYCHLDDPSVTLDEQVNSVHLGSDHAAAQLVQRLAWAVRDAEDANRAPRVPATREPAAGERLAQPQRRLPVAI